MPDRRKISFLKLPKKYSQRSFVGSKMKGGLTFEQIERTDKAALYKETNNHGWEVFEIRIGKPFAMKRGKKEIYFPMREKVPLNNDFGKWAWGYVSEDAARKKYDEIK